MSLHPRVSLGSGTVFSDSSPPRTVPTRLTTVEAVHEAGSWLCTVATANGRDEVVVLPCEDGVRAYLNTCTHERERLDRGDEGVISRGGAIVCPKHGSAFDTCSGECENGPAAGTDLVSVEITTNRGDVFLADDDCEFVHVGGIDGDDDGPSSTSHLRF